MGSINIIVQRGMGGCDITNGDMRLSEDVTVPVEIPCEQEHPGLGTHLLNSLQ
jgi:hypothetical protein